MSIVPTPLIMNSGTRGYNYPVVPKLVDFDEEKETELLDEVDDDTFKDIIISELRGIDHVPNPHELFYSMKDKKLSSEMEKEFNDVMNDAFIQFYAKFFDELPRDEIKKFILLQIEMGDLHSNFISKMKLNPKAPKKYRDSDRSTRGAFKDELYPLDDDIIYD